MDPILLVVLAIALVLIVAVAIASNLRKPRHADSGDTGFGWFDGGDASGHCGSDGGGCDGGGGGD